MGSGIAQVTAEAGYRVTLVDSQADALTKAVKSIKANLSVSVQTKFNHVRSCFQYIFLHLAHCEEEVRKGARR